MTKKNAAFVKMIGRQMRELPELDARQPIPLDLELRLEILKYIESLAKADALTNGTAMHQANGLTPPEHCSRDESRD